MQNNLTFSSRLNRFKKGKTVLEKIALFLKNYKMQNTISYNKKVNFLERKCYNYYLKKILTTQDYAKTVDFPYFIYEKHMAICSEAYLLAKATVNIAEKKYGRKFIEVCYKRELKKARP